MRPVLDSVVVRTGLILIIVLVLQVTLIPDLQIAGSSGDLMLLFALTSAMSAGADLGSRMAFAYGLAFDFMLQTPFGLSALVYSISAYVLGAMHRSMSRENWRVGTFTVVVATGIAVIGYAAIARVFGVPWPSNPRLISIVSVEVGFNAMFAPVALRICRWTIADLDPRRYRA